MLTHRVSPLRKRYEVIRTIQSQEEQAVRKHTSAQQYTLLLPSTLAAALTSAIEHGTTASSHAGRNGADNPYVTRDVKG